MSEIRSISVLAKFGAGPLHATTIGRNGGNTPPPPDRGSFEGLLVATPMVATTPTMKRLEAREAYLLQIGAELQPRLAELNFVPTFDPYAAPEPDR